MDNMRLNAELIEKIDKVIDELSPIKLGINKKNELKRLMFEICRRESRPLSDIERTVKAGLHKMEEKGEFFRRFKDLLVDLRYPSYRKGHNLHLLPVDIGKSLQECENWNSVFSPRKIFVEDAVRESSWTLGFLAKFPSAEKINIRSLGDAIRIFSGMDETDLYNTRRENVFLVRNKESFIKICPCTRGYKRCGYWVLNLGFGCPIDCSYCFLQLYSNAPGMILPANLDEYVERILEFDKKVSSPVRIGTGEFSDSLAVDRYTGYARELISVFAKCKNLILELKTKTADIETVLKEEANDNVVISWSVNPAEMASKYEQGGSPISARLESAKNAARRGYRVGFHFDPIIYYRGWENDYRQVVADIFSDKILRENTLWVSLGTLRYVPALKQVAERRFADNGLYYFGEFFEDTDGKVRYPRELRIKMYKCLSELIKKYAPKCWVYLCMEPEEVWNESGIPVRFWDDLSDSRIKGSCNM